MLNGMTALITIAFFYGFLVLVCRRANAQKKTCMSHVLTWRLTWVKMVLASKTPFPIKFIL